MRGGDPGVCRDEISITIDMKGGIFNQWFQYCFPDLERFRKDMYYVHRAILAACELLPVEILKCLLNSEWATDFVLGPQTLSKRLTYTNLNSKLSNGFSFVI